MKEVKEEQEEQEEQEVRWRKGGRRWKSCIVYLSNRGFATWHYENFRKKKRKEKKGKSGRKREEGEEPNVHSLSKPNPDRVSKSLSQLQPTLLLCS
jgi:hypothetical protein